VRNAANALMLDLSFEKLLVIGVVALFLIGPDKLPGFAAALGRWVRIARGMVDGAKERVREEMGPDFDEVDWQRLDPRQYDPRRIIRDALLDGPAPAERRTPSPRPAAAYVVEEEPAEAVAPVADPARAAHD
jgi:sec-independent protein translocase protein TatB